MYGVVDRVVPERGFGFVIGPNGESYFFHRSAVIGADFAEFGPGVTVAFQPANDKSDRPDEHLRAVEVRIADDAILAVENEPLPPEKVGGV